MENVKNILDRIHRPEIVQGKFGAFDGETTRYLKDDLGFIPFFIFDLNSSSLILKEDEGEKEYLPDNNNNYAELLSVKDGILNKKSVNRPNIKKVGGDGYDATHWIVIHDTGDIKLDAVGWNNRINTDNRQISWHFTVDDKDIFQHIPLEEVAWHAGDGGRTPLDRYENLTYHKKDCLGGGNRNGIGIETCIPEVVDYNDVMRNTAKLVAKLLVYFNLTADRIKQHHDFSGKNCPQSMRRLGTYAYFLELVQIEYELVKHFKDYKFDFKSLSPEILNDGGKILKKYAGEIKYQVVVSHAGKEEVFEYGCLIK